MYVVYALRDPSQRGQRDASKRGRCSLGAPFLVAGWNMHLMADVFLTSTLTGMASRYSAFTLAQGITPGLEIL